MNTVRLLIVTNDVRSKWYTHISRKSSQHLLIREFNPHGKRELWGGFLSDNCQNMLLMSYPYDV